eukprot:m.783020 g.783020  ORF g.783020 m.783020 type:complete len:63 (-) comp23291_c0_seq35:2933-3121(-)
MLGCVLVTGYAHGAYYSGIKAASLALRALGDADDLSEQFLCDDRRYTESAAFWAQYHTRNEV